MQINGKSHNFIELISHIGTTVIALPLISILESIAVAKAFCKNFYIFIAKVEDNR